MLECVEFTSRFGLISRFRPVRSPQNTGMAGAFVKTFKRDYVYARKRPDTQTALAHQPAWSRITSKSMVLPGGRL